MSDDSPVSTRPPRISSRYAMYGLCGCLFVSGAAGLAYEILWSRILSLSFGHTTFAVTTVLAVFMGGLALGSRYLGGLADRTARPWRLYGYLEIGIGIYCLAAPRLLAIARELYVSAGLSPGDYALRAFLRFTLSVLALIVPTTMMGGTLPAVSRALVRNSEEAGRKVGILYGANTVGASAGAFAVGYWLLPALGIRMTNLLGVIASLFAGSAVLFFFRGETLDRTQSSSAPEEEPKTRNPADRLLLWSFFLCGAVGMSYQIVWIRSLVLVIGSSTYAFSAVLVTFLSGIALGSLVFSKVSARNSLRFFSLLQFGIAASAFLLLPTFNLLPRVFFSLFKLFEASHRSVEFMQFLIVMAVVLLPTTLMGMTFPSLAGLLTRSMDRFGRDLGKFYAWNTVGAIGGTVVTGFLLVPHLGAQLTLVLGILANTILGTALLLFSPSFWRRVYAIATAFFVVPLFLLPKWDKQLMSSGVFYLGGERQQLDELTSLRFSDVLFLKEGISSTIAVVRFRDGSKGFLVNGKVDAGDNDMETQLNLATIPMLLHPEPRRVAVIGLGTGVTAGTAALFSRTDRIDVVELEPAVKEAAKFFEQQNHGVLENPKVHLYMEDGRNFFEETGNLYDVVISEPSNPWMRGIASLYTREFFETIHGNLGPHGILCQWVQGYAISPEELKMISRTFMEVFPDSTLWLASEGDLLFLGMKDALEIVDMRHLLARANGNRALIDAYRNYGEHPTDALLANYILGPGELRRYAGVGPLNTDDLPYLEFSAPRSLYTPPGFTSNRKDLFRHKTLDFPYFFQVPPSKVPALHYRVGNYNLKHGRPKDAAKMFIKASEMGFIPWVSMKQEGEEQFAHIENAGTIRESFDGTVRSVPLIPRLGGYRPSLEEKEDFAVWAANMDYFSSISGRKKGIGIGNSNALLVRSVPDVISSGFYVPLAVRPSTTYNVEFFMRSMLDNTGEAGAGILEYDAQIPTTQFTLLTERRNRLGSRSYVRVRGESGWKKHAFSFQTSPRTRMVHIFFFHEGADSKDPVIFDNIVIHQTR